MEVEWKSNHIPSGDHADEEFMALEASGEPDVLVLPVRSVWCCWGVGDYCWKRMVHGVFRPDGLGVRFEEQLFNVNM
jgi:hypothetical protein